MMTVSLSLSLSMLFDYVDRVPGVDTALTSEEFDGIFCESEMGSCLQSEGYCVSKT